MLGLLVLVALGGQRSACAQEDGDNGQIKKVFVIAMENHNWTQPANQFSGPIQQIFQNPNAPFINSLVNGTAVATINGHLVNISQQVAYATNYYNALATASGNNPRIFILPSRTIFGRRREPISRSAMTTIPLSPMAPRTKSTVRTINCTLYAC
jgi:hypothetical protein